MPAALETVQEYYKAFSTLDMNAIVSYFGEPFMAIGPTGVSSAGNRAELATLLAPLVDGLKTKGYQRSEFVQSQVTTLSETAAFVRGIAVRYAAAGSEMERIPISYLLHRSDAGWKIVVLVA